MIIDRNFIDNQIKAEWQRILGADGSGKGAVCPFCGSGTGKHGTGMTLVPGSLYTLKCFACGASGDVITLICQKYGWTSKADFRQAVQYLAVRLGYSVDDVTEENNIGGKKKKNGTDAQPVKKNGIENNSAFENALPAVRDHSIEDIFDEKTRAEMAKQLKEWNTHLSETDYWAKRGLSFDTVNHFNCGFAAEWRHPEWLSTVNATPRFIIPTGPISYLARETRDDKELNDFWKAKKKVKCNRQGIFNYDAVKGDIIFIVEGEIDAMSLYEVGCHNTVGLGSIAMVNKFVSMLDRDYIEKTLTQFPRAAVVALDNEDKKQVQNAKTKLTDLLKERGINTLDGTGLSGEHKDANDLLVADRNQLKENCRLLYKQAAKLPKLPMTYDPTAVEAKHEETLSDKKNKNANASLVLTGTTSTRAVLADCPVDYNIPEDYILSEDGLIVDGALIASRNAIVPIGFVINHHSRQQKVEISIRRIAVPNSNEYKWDNLIVDMNTIADKSKILELTNRGLMTTSGAAAGGVVKYLFDMIAMNQGVMPVREQFDQPGWNTMINQFRMPYLYTYYMPDLEPIYCTSGPLQVWLKYAKPLLENRIGALCIATAFAAPILRILGQRSFCLYIYGSSKAGKSAIQKLAVSAFGNPNKIMGTFNATMNGIEAMCVRSNDLPLLIDESTVANPSFSGEKMSYIISGEQQRVRMNRDMTQRPMKYWRLTVMMNGEGRMFDEASREGAMNRTLEIALDPDEKIFEDESKARECHKFINENYGTAGKLFIETLLYTRMAPFTEETDARDENGYPVQTEDFYLLKVVFKYFFDKLKEEYYPKWGLEQLSMMAVLSTAYFAIQFYLLAADKKTAVKETIKCLIKPNMRSIPTADDLTEDKRAWKGFVEYLQAHPLNMYGEHHFTAQGEKKTQIQTPILGERLGDYFDATGPDEKATNYVFDLTEVRVLPTAAKEILSKLGFNPTKLLKIFAQRGWIEKDAAGNNPLVIWAGSNGKRQRMVVIKGEKFTTEI